MDLYFTIVPSVDGEDIAIQGLFVAECESDGMYTQQGYHTVASTGNLSLTCPVLFDKSDRKHCYYIQNMIPCDICRCSLKGVMYILIS